MRTKFLEYLPAILILLIAFTVYKGCQNDNSEEVVDLVILNPEEPDAEHLRRYPDMAKVFESTFYHETGSFQNGQRWGKCGAVTWLIDSTGSKMSSGYHVITFMGDHYIAELGSGRYKLDIDGKAVSKTY